MDEQKQYTPDPQEIHPDAIPRQEAHPNLKAGNTINTGRPSKYKEEYCQQLVEHMKKGYSFESFGAVIDVSKDTLYEWSNVKDEQGNLKYPSFSDAVERGRLASLLFWEALGIQGAAGKIKANASIYALNMANKHKWLSGRQDVTSDGEKIESPLVYLPEEEKE